MGKCSACGRNRKLYLVIEKNGATAIWCAECIAKHQHWIDKTYPLKSTRLKNIIKECFEILGLL